MVFSCTFNCVVICCVVSCCSVLYCTVITMIQLPYCIDTHIILIHYCTITALIQHGNYTSLYCTVQHESVHLSNSVIIAVIWGFIVVISVFVRITVE
jgi:hypothetical protein